MKCILCKRKTNATVRENNICGNVPLCDDCKTKFQQCKECNEYYYKDTLKNGKCENCAESEGE